MNQNFSCEIELAPAGYERLARLCERYAMIGGNPDMGHVITLALIAGIEAQERLLDAAATQQVRK